MVKFEMKGTSNLKELIGRKLINQYGFNNEYEETYKVDVKKYKFPSNYIYPKAGINTFDFATVKLTTESNNLESKYYICSLNENLSKKECYNNVIKYIKDNKLDWEVEYGKN